MNTDDKQIEGSAVTHYICKRLSSSLPIIIIYLIVTKL